MRLLTLCFCVLLAACQAPTLHRFAVHTYTEEQPIQLNVSEVIVQSEVMQYDRMPHIEKKLPVSPEDALTEWADNRFYGAAPLSPDKAVITLKIADMTQTEEESAHWYVFNNDKYKLTYEVNIAFMRDDKVLYQHTVQGWESSSLPQRSSLADKEAAWQKMLNAMIRKVNGQIIQAVPKNFLVSA